MRGFDTAEWLMESPLDLVRGAEVLYQVVYGLGACTYAVSKLS